MVLEFLCFSLFLHFFRFTGEKPSVAVVDVDEQVTLHVDESVRSFLKSSNLAGSVWFVFFSLLNVKSTSRLTSLIADPGCSLVLSLEQPGASTMGSVIRIPRPGNLDIEPIVGRLSGGVPRGIGERLKMVGSAG